ncbi:MFS transporter [Mariniluteicoccus flavus]
MRQTRTPSRLALPSILAAQLVIPMSIAGTAVALPDIAADLGAAPGPLQWIVNGFNVVFALMTLVWGSLSDRFGQDRTFRLGIVIALAGSALSAGASSLYLLDAARVLAGIGAAAVLTGATAVISNGWEGKARARAFALFGTANGLGLALGPSVSGLLVHAFGWRGVFWAQAAMLTVALVGSVAVPRVRHAAPSRGLLDLGALRHPGFTAMALVPVAGAIGFVTLLTYLPNAFAAVHGLSADRAGLMMLLASTPVFVSPMVVSAVQQRWDSVTSGAVVAASLASLVVGTLGMVAIAPDRPLPLVAVPMILIGLGFGLPLGLVDGEALAYVPAHAAGAAAGLLNFLRIGSEAVAVAAYAAGLTFAVRARIPDQQLADRVASGQPGGAEAYAGSLHLVAYALAAAVIVVSVAIWRLRQTADLRASATPHAG